jgi:hypothetical protein
MRKPPVGKSKPVGSIESADEDALEAFCSQIEVEEFNFESWRDLHDSLDIIIPFYISCELAQTGCTREVEFSRNVSRNGHEIQREKASVSVIIPPGIDEGWSKMLPGLGDAQDENRGDLKVIIRFSG